MLDVVSRVFIGYKLPAAVAAGIAEIQMTLRRKVIADLRWNDPNECVINLVPLGEQMIDRVAQLPQMLEPAVRGFGPLNLKLEGLNGLPNAVQPRYVCLAIAGDVQALMTLQANIQRAMFPLVGQPEGRGFQPHIILGRLRQESEPQRVALGRGMRLLQNAQAGAFTLDSVGIIRNVAAEGVSYEVLKAFPLVG